MTAVSQQIPSYHGGISEQPDSLKKLGQVKDVVNAIPDITWGLYKRPGSKRIGIDKFNNVQDNGSWFHYYRDESEGSYIGQINDDGIIRMWSCIDGKEKNVWYHTNDSLYNASNPDHVALSDYLTSKDITKITLTNGGSGYTTAPAITITNTAGQWGKDATATCTLTSNTGAVDSITITNAGKNYLHGATVTIAAPSSGTTATATATVRDDIESIQALTINDTTYLTNRTKIVKTTGTTDSKPHPYTAYINILRTENGRQYGLNISTPDGARDDTISRATRVKIKSDSLSEVAGTGNCPGIGTQVFSVTADTDYTDTNIVGVYDEHDNTISESKSNLIFRVTTLGQVSNVEGSSTSFKCTYNREVDLLHGGEGWATGDKCTVTLDQAQTNYNYTIEVVEHETATLKADVKLLRPSPTPFDADTAVTLDTILGSIQQGLSGVTVDGSNLDVDIIGNGLYLSCSKPFTVEGTDADLMRVMQSDINDVTNLPDQCKHGYIVKVTNARIAEEDDYYLKFVGESNSSGTGSWVECAAPDIIKSFDPTTMPHKLVRQADGNFLFTTNFWADRSVGDDATNQAPSFVGDPTYSSPGIATYSENKKINKVLFHRNRLAFLSGENVILSRPGEFSEPNFWAETALTVSAIDPIDIASSSMFPSDLYDGIEITVGLVLFSTNQQFLLSSDDIVLNPDTAKLKSISAYNYNETIPPISLGMSIGYVDNSGKYSRFNEMSLVEREREPVVVETSKLVPSLLEKNIDIITNSRENQIVLFGKTNSNIVYGFKYLFTGEKRPQTSWFKWKLNQNLIHHFIIDDSYYYLDSDHFLQQINLVQDTDESITHDNTNYLVHIDNYVANVTGGLFNPSTNKTTFNTSWLDGVSSSTNDLVVADTDGRYGKCSRDGTSAIVDGDWSSATVDIGFLYDYEVDLPTLYVSSSKKESLTSDINGSLIVHRINLNFGKIGSYETILTRVGKDTYTGIYESNSFDLYETGDVPYLSEAIKTIPVYERNTNVDITLKSTNPSPATLHSMSWEGDYTQRYYKRV